MKWDKKDADHCKVIHRRSNAKAITKIKPRPKQINEYRGLGTTNERRDLAKKWIMDKFSEQWEAYLKLFPCHTGKENTCCIDTCSVNCRIWESRSCANSHNIPYKAYMGNSPKYPMHVLNHFSNVISSVCGSHCMMSFVYSKRYKKLSLKGVERESQVTCLLIKKLTQLNVWEFRSFVYSKIK